MTTVLIGQADTLQGHFHDTDRTVQSLDRYIPGGSNYFGGGGIRHYESKITSPISDGINGEVRISSETRSKNITVKYWKRIA